MIAAFESRIAKNNSITSFLYRLTLAADGDGAAPSCLFAPSPAMAIPFFNCSSLKNEMIVIPTSRGEEESAFSLEAPTPADPSPQNFGARDDTQNYIRSRRAVHFFSVEPC